MNFAELAGDDDTAPPDASAAPPKKKSSFAELAGPVPARAAANDSAPPTFQFNDPAEMRATLARSNQPGLLAAFDKQYSTVAPPVAPGAGAGRGTTPASAYAPPRTGADAIPTSSDPAMDAAHWQATLAARAQQPAPAKWYDKARAGVEAAANTVGALTGTPTPPQSTQSPLGREYTQNISDLMTEHGPSLVGVGPEIGALGQMLAQKGQTAGVAIRAVQGARGAAERIEPTMGAAPAAATAAAESSAAAAPTLAKASPELQQAVAAAGSKANPSVVARHVEADTLPVPGKLTEGQATQDPVLISREMNGRGKEKPSVPPQFYQQQGQTLAANMDAIRASAAPDIPNSASVVDHGQALLDAYKTKDAAAAADVSAKYKALTDANGGALPLDGRTLAANTAAALSKQLKSGAVPADLQSALNQFENGRQMTFEDFETLRSDAADAMRTSTDGRARAAAGIIRQQLEEMPLTPEAASLKPLADAARGAARARFEAIEADPAYKAAVNDPTPLGHPSPAADKFFNSFVRDGKTENVARMRANLQDSPQAAQTIAAGTLDHLKGQLKADPVTGNFSQAGYSKALSTLGPKMGSLVDPVTAQQLQAVSGFAKNAQTQPRGSYVNNSNTAVELAAQGTKAALEHGTNVLFGGIPVGTVTRKVGGAIADTVGARKAANNALAPGAGLTRLSDLMKD